jgi:hypothetical protein
MNGSDSCQMESYHHFDHYLGVYPGPPQCPYRCPTWKLQNLFDCYTHVPQRLRN